MRQYSSQTERDAIPVYEQNGIKYAFLSYTIPTNGLSAPTGKEYYVNVYSRELVKKDVEQAREKGAEVVMVAMHWGVEYTHVPNEEQKEVCLYSSLKRSRRYLLDQLNKIRLKSGLNLTETSFNSIGEILKNSLNELEKECDYESYRVIIILATSLYKTSEETNKPRIFLQSYIQNFQIWKKFNFWKDLIQYEINEEMIKQKKYNMFNKENDQYKLKRIQLIVKSQLNTYLFNMISFDTDTMTMYDIITFFKNYYFLDKNVVDLLNNIVKNYSQNKNDMTNIQINNINNKDKKKEETMSETMTKNETITTNDNEENDEVEIIKNSTLNIEGNILNNLIQKQPCDNILKAKKRQKQEKINEKNNQNTDNINTNLNINLINKDNNDNNDDTKEDTDIDKNNNYLEINESMKSKKSNSDEYKEEDIVSKIALTEFSIDKNETFDLFSIREKANLNIINEDTVNNK